MQKDLFKIGFGYRDVVYLAFVQLSEQLFYPASVKESRRIAGSFEVFYALKSRKIDLSA